MLCSSCIRLITWLPPHTFCLSLPLSSVWMHSFSLFGGATVFRFIFMFSTEHWTVLWHAMHCGLIQNAIQSDRWNCHCFVFWTHSVRRHIAGDVPWSMDAAKLGDDPLHLRVYHFVEMAMLILRTMPFSICFCLYFDLSLVLFVSTFLLSFYRDSIISSILLEPTQSAGHHLESLNGPSFNVLFCAVSVALFLCVYSISVANLQSLNDNHEWLWLI